MSPTRKELISYYFNMGCVFVRDYVVRYDAWELVCGIGMMTADPHRVPVFADLFERHSVRGDFERLYADQRIICDADGIGNLMDCVRRVENEACLQAS